MTRKWSEWPHGVAVTIAGRPGLWRYQHHRLTAGGERIVVANRGRSGARVTATVAESQVQRASDLDVTMCRAASRRALVVTPGGLGLLTYWAPKGDDCRVETPTGGRVTYRKTQVALADDWEEYAAPKPGVSRTEPEPTA